MIRLAGLNPGLGAGGLWGFRTSGFWGQGCEVAGLRCSLKAPRLDEGIFASKTRAAGWSKCQR